MYPCVILPTFWMRRRSRGTERTHAIYDHPTPVDQDGTLPDLLRSLEAVRGLGRVLVLVATTDSSIEHEAEDRVRGILADFPEIDAFVIGAAEMGSLHRRMEQLEFADLISGVSLSGYGAVRNAGLIAAAVLGSPSVVFVDDDQIITDPGFLETALEGIGERTASGKVIMAKSGYYTDEAGNYRAQDKAAWSDTFWRQNEFYNQALEVLTAPPRIRPSSLAFGGCLALHRDMYCNVSFDPWVARGEDIDYVVNARMHGGDVFLDDEWSVVHKPPSVAGTARHFRQDVYRFIYEHRKLEFSKSQVDLRQVTPESLMPYPGQLVGSSIGWRARMTALLRAISGRERKAYFSIARNAVPQASDYARSNCERYFAFQRRWPMLMDRLWEDIALKSLFTGERRVDRSAITGRFPMISTD
ncbi:MAG: hypothetical protein JXE06_08010 [Coriobacteriia bacterium]|nr:hypothetical protein [Coriobacteriia bacterium]MBN2822892.1 hypothetical protein [Coriobacteriia bacterium]